MNENKLRELKRISSFLKLNAIDTITISEKKTPELRIKIKRGYGYETIVLILNNFNIETTYNNFNIETTYETTTSINRN